MPGTVIVMAGGEAPAAQALADLPAGTPCVAADSGFDHALALGLSVVALVGDLDSVSPAGLARAEAAARRGELSLERHPADKDQTDLELALHRALGLGPDLILVAGIGGGRIDHLVANLAVLADPRWAPVAVDGLLDGARLRVVRRQRRFRGRVGELVSLLAVNGDAEGVTTEGLVWPLRGETLRAGTSRGVSNQFAAEEASVSLQRGTLLVVQPGLLGPPR